MNVNGPGSGAGPFGFIFWAFMRMVTFITRRLRGALRPWPAPALCLFAIPFLAAPARAATFLIDGDTKLSTVSNGVPAKGETRFRFTGRGYETPGSLTLVNNTCDSLIFERGGTSETMLTINDVLLHLQGQKGRVVFRGLALKIKSGGALFDSNQSGNQNLLFDSCTVLGDSASLYKVFHWGGSGSSEIVIRNSHFAYTGGIGLTGASSITVAKSMFVATGPITMASIAGAGTISLTNNLFNGTGLFSAAVSTRLEMRYNTSNKTQFLLDGSFSAICDIRNNYFAHPPAKNALPQGGSSRYATFFKGGSFPDSVNTVSANARDSAWDGFEYLPGAGSVTLFGASTNTVVHTPKDSGVAWDWKLAGDTTHGAWNGAGSLANFNIYPPNASVSLTVRGGQALFQLLPSPFPRLVTPKIGTASYA